MRYYLTRNKLRRRALAILMVAFCLVPVGLAVTSLAEAPSTGRFAKPEVRGGLSRTIQGLFGINLLATKVAERQIEKEIRDKVSGDLDVKVVPFSGLDLAQGKARQILIEGQDLLYENSFYVKNFKLTTDRDTPVWLDLKSGKLKSPLQAVLEVRITEEDFRRSFQTVGMKKYLQNIKLPILDEDQTLTVLSPKVAFTPELLHFEGLLSLMTEGEVTSELPLRFHTGLEAYNNNRLLRLKNVEIDPIPGVTGENAYELLAQNGFKSIVKPSKLLPLNGGDFEIRKMVIGENDILFSAKVLLLPKVKK